MKKIVKCAVALLIIYFIGCSIYGNKAYAVRISEEPTVIFVERKITAISGKVENKFKYSITPVDGNPSAVENMPKEFFIEFNDEYTEDVANATISVDLSNANFPERGTYKFKIKEVSSSNDEVYLVDTKNSYEVFIVVSNESGVEKATLIGPAEHYVSDVDQNEKTSIEFCTEKVNKDEQEDKKEEKNTEEKNDKEESTIKKIIKSISPKTGDNVIWYSIGLSIAVVFVIVVLIIKKKSKNNTNDSNDDKKNN